ncbi:FecR family protein [Flammeovirgaceae bacterium SG7u.111]|nr:FecR family protein [Flammeovirgaceae bacterium SG7u.132]WPO34171.1 FecR family protein [Flammeovirgaceae bacterium SG7u.111]
MKYNNYNISNFISDDFFVQWVQNPDAESEFFWRNWLEKHPEKWEEVQKAKDIVTSIKPKNEYLPSNEEFIEVLENVHRVKSSSRPFYSFSVSKAFFAKVAASIIFIIALSIGYYSLEGELNNALSSREEGAISYVTKKTARGQKLTITLIDGTVVKLNAESSIKIPSDFGVDARNVILTGEAFFKVTKDSLIPFIINSDGLVTKVLGTSFNIRSYPEENIEKVTVVTGKISVKNTSYNKDILLKESFLLPNQSLLYDKDKKEELINRNVDVGEELGWVEGVLRYDNVDLDKILKDLERWYDVDFEVSTKVDQNGIYTGSFDNQSLENVLQGLSFMSKGFEYKIEGKKVFLSK